MKVNMLLYFNNQIFVAEAMSNSNCRVVTAQQTKQTNMKSDVVLFNGSLCNASIYQTITLHTKKSRTLGRRVVARCLMKAQYESVPLGEGELAPSPSGSNRWPQVVLAFLALSAVAAVSAHRTAPAPTNSKAPTSTLVNKGALQQKDSTTIDYVGCIDGKLGPVLGGVDLVAYFSMGDGPGERVSGSSSYSTTYEGYSFYFKDQKNLNLFEASPTSYLPQNGGFCSWGIGEEAQWSASSLGPSADPDVWKMIDGKLYFFMYDEPMERFMGTATDYSDSKTSDAPAAYIADAESRWSEWFGDSVVMNTGCLWADATSDQGAKELAIKREASFQSLRGKETKDSKKA